MNIKTINYILFFAFYFIVANEIVAQEQNTEPSVKSLIKNTSISGQYFIAYDYNDSKKLHDFRLKRGYFTLKTKLNDMFSVRYTQDITLDNEGSDAGNVEIRLKYLYLKAKLSKINFLKNTYIEVGLAHTPWLDFEQHINRYRVQGTMFSDGDKLLTSADFGLTFAGIIGGKIDEKYQKEVNKKEAGKYGSFAIGVFNGGGYHAIEKNSNKTFQSRISIRPLPNIIPGIQLSHGFFYGKANRSDTTYIPDAILNIFMLSSESKYHTFTAQYTIGSGNYSGKYIDSNNKSIDNEGFSFFGEFKIPKSKFALFSRYDNFKLYETTTNTKETIIAGLSYNFLKNKILIDYQQVKTPSATINYYELALEIAF